MFSPETERKDVHCIRSLKLLNCCRDGKKKQNVKCVRYDIDGESHVLLVACRDIACGEKLYYDYNGYEHAYPTHHFL